MEKSNLRKVINLLNLVNEIVLNGGVSYNVNTHELNPTTGFMVSVEGLSETVTTIDEDVIARYILKHAIKLSKQDVFFGVWFDGQKYVMDVSYHFERKRDAVFWAIVHDQKAIWDCALKNEIFVGKKQTSFENEKVN